MLHVQCNNCGRWALTSNGERPDDAVVCNCCPEDHSHFENTAKTGIPCRPVTITLMGGVNVGM